MQLQKLPDGSIHMAGLNPWDVQTFRNLPDLADYSAHPAAEKRLLPPPAADADLSPEMAMDWVEYVVPELRESFAGNLKTVLADLDTLTPDAAPEPAPPAEESSVLREAAPALPKFQLTIPGDHVEAWFRAMNQARLVLSARYGMDSENVPDLDSLLESGQLEHWFHYELFATLQGWLVDAVLDPE